MTTLILVRHGQASFGARNYDALSAEGRRQGELLGRHWANTGFELDAAYHGAMARQRDTALLALGAMNRGDLTPGELAHFNEFDFENLFRSYTPLIAREQPQFAVPAAQLFTDRRTFQAYFDLVIGKWLGGHSGTEPIKESWVDFQARVIAGLRQVAPPDAKQVVIFTSGGVIAAALREALQISDEMAFRLNARIHNASQHVFHLGKRGLSLLAFNQVPHLELAREPSLLTFR
jgi:broad specificity phosphatase PhoE